MKDKRKSYLTIGELVRKFRKFYPDLTSSKLRFLEARGLVIPGRADNRYRIYFKNDVRKIDAVLKMQRDFFLPLEIIKERLETINFGNMEKDKSGTENLKLLQSDLQKKNDQIGLRRMTADEACQKFKVSRDFLNEMLKEGFISLIDEGGKSCIEGADIEILRIAAELSGFGILPKNLKLFENSAIRHSSFLQQIVYPYIMIRKKDSYRKASKLLFRLENSFLEFNEKLFKKENKKFLETHK